MIARKLRMEVPWSIEAIIDSGNATPEIIAEYEAMQAAARARWMARPLRVRAYWTIRSRLGRYGVRSRLAHAARALRGIECERD